MRALSPPPDAADAPPELFDGGHLWVQELVDGVWLRFRLGADGALRFAGPEGPYEGEVPLSLRRSVRHVRERLDRAALRAATDAESVVFAGVATRERALPYDFGRLPPFLGVAVHDGRLRSPDAVEGIYDRLGLVPVNTFEQEVRAADVDPEDYEVPASNWYDGPARGVLLRNKTGQWATLDHPDAAVEPPDPTDTAATDLAEHATADFVEEIAAEVADAGRPVTVDAVCERAVEALARAHATHFEGRAPVDPGAFRSAVAERVARHRQS
jgi:hypothetical protein